MEFSKDVLASNNETMMAKVEIVGNGGRKSKIKMTAADIRRLYEGRSSEKEGYHLGCRKEKWEDKKDRDSKSHQKMR